QLAGAPLNGSPWAEAAHAGAEHAPYLKRLLERRGDLLADADQTWPERLVAQALADAVQIEAEPRPMIEGMAVLRRAKDAVHLACAMADLSRAWPLARVTRALTDFADASLRAALAMTAREAVERGDLAQGGTIGGSLAGYVLLALGKMGAHELNY